MQQTSPKHNLLSIVETVICLEVSTGLGERQTAFRIIERYYGYAYYYCK